MALSVMEQKTSTQKKKDPLSFDWLVYGVLRHFQQYLRYIVAVSFIYWRRKPEYLEETTDLS